MLELDNYQRLTGLELLLLCAAILGWGGEDFVYPGLMALLAILGYAGRYQPRFLQVRFSRLFILMLVIALAYAFYYRITAQRLGGLGRTGSDVKIQALTSARYFLLLMTAQFFLAGKKPLTPWVLLFGLVVFLNGGQLIRNANENVLFQSMAVLFSTLLALFCLFSRKSAANGKPVRTINKRIAVVFCLFLAIFGGWLGGQMLNRYHPRIVSFIFRFNPRFYNPHRSRETAVGFSNNSQLSTLSTIKQTNGTQVALRVISDTMPGYLRAQVYDMYNSGAWQSSSNPQPVLPQDSDLSYMEQYGRGNTFRILAEQPVNPQIMTVWPSPSVNTGMFTPYGTLAVKMPAREILVDQNNIIDCEELIGGIDYSLAVLGGPPKEIIADNFRQDYLRIPSDLDGRVRWLADEIFARCRTDDEKMAAVERYFHENFTYHLGIQVPPGNDPVTWFLMNNAPAHCEYFASAAALLLRLGGVPTRYVTGFVVSEYNSVSNLWLARNRDAHAWVEAYDNRLQKWMLVEATPASGVPEKAEMNYWAGLLDWVKLKLQEMRVALFLDGFKGLTVMLFVRLFKLVVLLFTTTPGYIILTVTGAIFAWRFWLRYRDTHREYRPDQRLIVLKGLLNRMDAMLTRRKYQRQEGETLHQFAGRILQDNPEDVFIAKAADWYRLYASVRYQAVEQPERVQELRQGIISNGTQKTAGTKK